jgi:hypothetical protein
VSVSVSLDVDMDVDVDVDVDVVEVKSRCMLVRMRAPSHSHWSRLRQQRTAITTFHQRHIGRAPVRRAGVHVYFCTLLALSGTRTGTRTHILEMITDAKASGTAPGWSSPSSPCLSCCRKCSCVSTTYTSRRARRASLTGH